ncbi:MAG: hypothetical protein [Bacteriophage sp.]|nr:MAG: hypothetical protein [Bacteriophage sp.]
MINVEQFDLLSGFLVSEIKTNIQMIYQPSGQLVITGIGEVTLKSAIDLIKKIQELNFGNEVYIDTHGKEASCGIIELLPDDFGKYYKFACYLDNKNQEALNKLILLITDLNKQESE